MKHSRGRRGARAAGKTTEYNEPGVMFGGGASAQARRKTEQLCKQVEERIGLVLAGEVDDPLLQEVYVAAVHAEPGGANLIVSLAFPPGTEDPPVAEVLRRIEALRPLLRAEIASAITRKRTPGLTFRVVRLDLFEGGEEVA